MNSLNMAFVLIQSAFVRGRGPSLMSKQGIVEEIALM